MESTPANQPEDIWLGEYKDSLPTMLNVLTLLTIIWNPASVLLHFATFAMAPFSYRNSVNANHAIENMPPIMRSLFGNTEEATRLAFENRLPILLIGLAGAFLCFFGALRMRKRKKAGFVLYIIGDILPILNIVFFTVLSTFTGIAAGIGVGISAIFVILYATQLKYMR
jgi:hypothetical protein